MSPENRVPQVGDSFWDQSQDEGPGVQHTILEVGEPIEDGPYLGRNIATILNDEEVWFDCFWSDIHQRFQYFSDQLEHVDEGGV